MIEFQIKTDESKIVLQDTVKRLSDMRPFFVNFWAYMQSRTQLTFTKLRKGGKFRGVTWPWFAGQYTRVTDGVKVPAEGGVARLSGKGTVKGRFRGKGKSEKDRVKPTSNLLRHRGVMYNAALSQVKKTATRLEMDTPVNYADEQNAMRPFQFFELPKDGQIAARMAGKYISRGK